MDLNEAIEVAEELAEWYVEGMDHEDRPTYERQRRDLDMLDFFIKVGKELNVQIDTLESNASANWLGDITAKEVHEILRIIAQKEVKND